LLIGAGEIDGNRDAAGYGIGVLASMYALVEKRMEQSIRV